MRKLTLLPVLLAVSACSSLPFGQKSAPAAGGSDLASEFAPTVSVQPLGGAGQTAASLDATSAEEKAAALAAPATGARDLGRAVVALGPPAEQGLWVSTSFVQTTTKGRVTAPNGQSLSVELRPTTGGALMSLSAYQALGIGLTELPELKISAL